MAAETTDIQFEEDVLQSDQLVLVDFWAEWCGPCKQLSPVIDEIANDKADSLKVVKVNIDKNPETPAKYNVRGIPTLVLFKNGTPIATKVGAIPKSSLEQWIDSSSEASSES